MKKHICELLISVIVGIGAILLLLVGLKAIDIPMGKCLLFTVPTCLFACSLAVSLLQKNRIGIFFAGTFAVLAAAGIILAFGISSRSIYPLYIAALPVGGLAVAAFTQYPKRIIAASAALLGASALLLLESLKALPLGAVLPIVALYFAVLGIIYASLKLHDNKKNDKEDLQ